MSVSPSSAPATGRTEVREATPTPAAEVKGGDLVVGRDGSLLAVDEVRLSGAGQRVTITLATGREKVWTVPADRIVQVVTRITCHKCGGHGRHYSGGAVVNGVYTGRTGDCFGCHGRGVQTRADIQRNHFYWTKYARV